MKFKLILLLFVFLPTIHAAINGDVYVIAGNANIINTSTYSASIYPALLYSSQITNVSVAQVNQTPAGTGPGGSSPLFEEVESIDTVVTEGQKTRQTIVFAAVFTVVMLTFAMYLNKKYDITPKLSSKINVLEHKFLSFLYKRKKK